MGEYPGSEIEPDLLQSEIAGKRPKTAQRSKLSDAAGKQPEIGDF